MYVKPATLNFYEIGIYLTNICILFSFQRVSDVFYFRVKGAMTPINTNRANNIM